MCWYALTRGTIGSGCWCQVWRFLLRWCYEEACPSSFLLIGVVLRGNPNDLGCTVPCLWDQDVWEKGGELIRPNYTLENFTVLEETINSLVLTYAPGVSVFPARSSFTPGWVYVHVGGGTRCCCRVPFLTVCSCFLLCTATVHRETLCHTIDRISCSFCHSYSISIL